MYIDTSNASSGRVCLNAAKADQLATARTITLSGDASGSVSFDGSKNVTLNVTVGALEDLEDAINAKPNAASNGIKIENNTIKHTNSVTASTAKEGGSSRALAFGGSFNVPSVTYDAQGHITSKGSIALTLPANPNTDTKVTSAGNHYTPSADSKSALSVDASSTTKATWGSTSLVTGVNLQRDAKGHVTGVTVDSIQMPANPNSNTAHSHTAGDGLVITGSGGLSGTTTYGLADSGVTAGTYGPSAAVTGNNNATINIPEITVDDYGRVTKVTNRVYTSKNTTYSSLKNPNALTIKGNGTSLVSYDGSSVQSVDLTASAVGALPVAGGTLSGSITLDGGNTDQKIEPNIQWKTINENTPYFGFAQDQVDGTFLFSLKGTNYQSGLAIGGGSGNLLWKGGKVATVDDIPTTLKNPKALTIKGNGTTSFTYDGSTAKTLNIKGSGSTTVTSDTSGNITISSTGTTYSAGTGISLSGTTFSNSGVRQISASSNPGALMIDTNGAVDEVFIPGLGSAAYSSTSDYDLAGAATTALNQAKNYTDSAITTLVGGAPDLLNTLGELAEALGEDANFSTTLTNSLAGKLDKSGGTVTGPLTLQAALNFGTNGALTVNSSKALLYNSNTVYHSGNLGAATTTANGLMTKEMVTKLNSLQATTQQNTFTTISDGTNSILAKSTTSTVKFSGTNNISVSANASNDTVTISGANLLPLSAGSTKKLTGALGLTANVMYGTALPATANAFEGQLFFLEDDTPNLPKGGAAGAVLAKISTADNDATWVTSVNSAKKLASAVTVNLSGDVSGSFSFDGATASVACTTTVANNSHTHTWSNISDRTTLSINTSGSITAATVKGAVWNDYAEYREQEEEIKPGYCVTSSNDGKVRKTTEKFQACDGIVSDTFGFSIGETDKSKTPLAVAGRVLAYCEGNRYDYNAGDTVCAGPDGKVVKMTREEIREWPDRIVGIVSEIPEYKTWGTGNVLVDDRIWIKVK